MPWHYTWPLIKGVLLAQLGLPLGFAIVGLVTGVVDGDSSLTGTGSGLVLLVLMALVASVIGMFFTVPISLLVVVPVSLGLKKLSALNRWTIALGAAVVSISVATQVSSKPLEMQLYYLPISGLAAWIYWLYLRRSKVLDERY